MAVAGRASTLASVDLFERQWQTYRSVVDRDWMEHRGLTAACAEAMQSWLADHPGRAGRARLLDLGCGDLALMAPVLRGLPLGAYLGVDSAANVLPAARAALGETGFPAEFRHGDIHDVVDGDGDGPGFDIVHAALVLHHLTDEEKAQFLSSLRRRVRPDGILVWADVFREPGESLPDYAARYAERIRTGWTALDRESRESIVAHMSACDFPADRDAVVGMARNAGWRWRWLWKGRHRAEAVALLTPDGRH